MPLFFSLLKVSLWSFVPPSLWSNDPSFRFEVPRFRKEGEFFSGISENICEICGQVRILSSGGRIEPGSKNAAVNIVDANRYIDLISIPLIGLLTSLAVL